MFVNESSEYDVVVVGAGPVGLVLATELRLAGVHVLVLERRDDVDTAIKAEGINAAASAAFERRGLLPALTALHRPFSNDAGVVDPRPRFVGHFGGIQVPAGPVDVDDPILRDRGPAGWQMLLVPQAEVERILGRRAAELGVEVRRGVEVRDVDADESGVTVAWDGEGGDVRAGWLVGCDGGRSVVRRLAAFDFAGTDPELTGRQGMFTVAGAEDLPRGWQYTPTGLFVSGPAPGRLRTIEFDGPPADRDAPVTAAEMEASVRRVSGVEVRISEVHAAARFTDNARQATTYRRGRVLLCGDAAHVHSPFSGQGLNLGIGDAVNLGWKLASTVAGCAPDGLLDSYTRERHPVGAWVLDWTRAQVAVMRGDAQSRALRDVVRDLLHTRDGATAYVKNASGLSQRYDLGEDDPAVGRTTANLLLADGTRLLDHGRDGRFLLVDPARDERVAMLAQAYAGRVRVVPGGEGGAALLVRPDGIVAWASAEGVDDLTGLGAALMRWLLPVSA